MKTDRGKFNRQRGLAQTGRHGSWVAETLVSLAIIAILVALFLPATRSAPGAAERSHCKNNLKQIGLALHNYHDDYGAFPPAFTVNANGQPLHSWRTLILPYLDQKALYEAINLSKPWNDPANAEAFKTSLPIYLCPSADVPDEHTTYQALVGPECAFRPADPQRIEDITDEISNTVLVIETPPAATVHWMSPSDSAREFFLNFVHTKDKSTRLSHIGGFYTLIGDGTARFLDEATRPETRQALSTIAGGETISEF